MGAEFSECHCRATGESVAHHLLATAAQDGRTISVEVFAGETLACGDQRTWITSGGSRIGIDEPGVFTRLFLVTATDPSGWSVVYPYPRIWAEYEFDSLVGSLECDALFGFSSEKTFAWAWAEYRRGDRVDSCSYVEPAVWSRNGRAGPGDEPAPELRPARVFASHGREFTKRTFWWALSGCCASAAGHRSPFQLVEVKERFGE